MYLINPPQKHYCRFKTLELRGRINSLGAVTARELKSTSRRPVRRHCEIASRAVDEQIAVRVVPEVRPKNFKAFYHSNFSIISSRAPSVRSSRSAFRDSKRDRRSTKPSIVKSSGGYNHSSISTASGSWASTSTIVCRFWSAFHSSRLKA